ncbi:MAG: hypothetical protein PHX51_00945 [Clostridia bacterium]|nr:hypothetical protein [Clostridia bacterium]
MKKTFIGKVDYLTEDFRGVCKGNDEITVVDFCLPQEEIVCEIEDKRGKVSYGKNVKVTMPSPDRVKPECPYFYECSNCALQFVDYGKQLLLKRESVEKVLKNCGFWCGADVCEGIFYPYRYRNALSFDVEYQKGEIAIGYYREKTKKTLDICDCKVCERWHIDVIAAIKTFCGKFDVTAYNKTSQIGMLRGVHLLGAEDSLLVLLDISSGKLRGLNTLKEELSKIKTNVGLWVRVFADQTHFEQPIFVCGEKLLWAKRGKAVMPLVVGSKYRVNEKISELIIDKISDICRDEENMIVIGEDNGVLATQFSKRGFQTLCIDRQKEKTLAYEVEKRNRESVITEFCDESLFAVAHERRYGKLAQTVVADVRGSYAQGETLGWLKRIDAQRVICLIESKFLEENLLAVKKTGYALKYVKPYDFLPQTKHTLALCMFAKKD